MKTVKQIGVVGVDAGMIMVGDPCYFIGKDSTACQKFPTWYDACNQIFCKEDAGDVMAIDNLGIAVSTTHGDGSYPVYLEEDDNGRRRIIVDLG